MEKYSSDYIKNFISRKEFNKAKVFQQIININIILFFIAGVSLMITEFGVRWQKITKNNKIKV